MWASFRILAARLGLSAKEVEAVENGGNATTVQHPAAEHVHFMVRPDPDWSQRMLEAATGKLINSRQETAGVLALDEGLLSVGNADAPSDSATASVTPGEYRLVLTIAYSGAKKTFDYEEHVSHAFLTLQQDYNVAVIEPYFDADGVEVRTEALLVAFAIPGKLPRIAGDHAGRWTLRLSEMSRAQGRGSGEKDHYSVVVSDDDGSTAAIACYAEYGRNDYPLFRLVDDAGRIVGIASDFYVDNRPWN